MKKLGGSGANFNYILVFLYTPAIEKENNFDYKKDYVVRCLNANKHNHITTSLANEEVVRMNVTGLWNERTKTSCQPKCLLTKGETQKFCRLMFEMASIFRQTARC